MKLHLLFIYFQKYIFRNAATGIGLIVKKAAGASSRPTEEGSDSRGSEAATR